MCASRSGTCIYAWALPGLSTLRCRDLTILRRRKCRSTCVLYIWNALLFVARVIRSSWSSAASAVRRTFWRADMLISKSFPCFPRVETIPNPSERLPSAKCLFSVLVLCVLRRNSEKSTTRGRCLGTPSWCFSLAACFSAIEVSISSLFLSPDSLTNR